MRGMPTDDLTTQPPPDKE